jgi:hypothetical protein
MGSHHQSRYRSGIRGEVGLGISRYAYNSIIFIISIFPQTLRSIREKSSIIHHKPQIITIAVVGR